MILTMVGVNKSNDINVLISDAILNLSRAWNKLEPPIIKRGLEWVEQNNANIEDIQFLDRFCISNFSLFFLDKSTRLSDLLLAVCVQTKTVNTQPSIAMLDTERTQILTNFDPIPSRTYPTYFRRRSSFAHPSVLTPPS